VPTPVPLARKDRISTVDTVRGFALLGILLFNIVPFAMHGSAYDNPTAVGGDTGANLLMWFVLHVVAEGKMRCLFSLMFGVSVILFTSRLEGHPQAADLYYRRTLWLLVFGIAHSFLLWAGDILYPYALCGLCLYPLRRLSARGLLALSAAMIVYCGVCYFVKGNLAREVIEKGRTAAAKADRGETLTTEERANQDEWVDFRKERNPSADVLAHDIEEWRGNPWSVIRARAAVVLWLNSHPLYHQDYIDALAMMLLGMALAKLGFFEFRTRPGVYLRWVAAGYGIGIPLHVWNGLEIIRSGFDPVVQSHASSVYDIGRLAVAAGHMGLLAWLCRTGRLRWVTERLGAVGQMALSNYVGQSVICSLVFTGYGLRLYGTLERHQLLYVCAGIWVVQLAFSPWWLRYHRFGPLEWAWRSLTYWQRQPQRLSPPLAS
jgi:uncharacterized protein